ncbi:DNA repair protein RadC [Paenibacillus sp. 1_12]|uniref:RadC family protein n=1 Tax=Paenibacillus sp. 1_12 TaxID=1566278 RepID=UPI0008E0B082|nr:DNA repair protein RadC [Paenibacillus sp. 1_12]SFK75968.1 DNA repair protein RadC [Paenibacillus sp. 1_12]
MNEYKHSELKSLLTDLMCERQGSYMIEELFQHFPSVSELAEASEQQLVQVKGIGVGKARQLLAMLKLARALTAPVQDPYTIRNPQDVFSLLEADLRHLQQEYFVCLFLNTKNHLISREILSKGSLNASIVHPREVFRAAIKRASASIVCVHNHPSTDPSPSPVDIEITKRLVAAGEIIGIDILDHIIIGGHRFYSLKEKGHM